MTIWAAGMFCVCVREYDAAALGADYVFPIKGTVYTVREVVVSDDGNDHLCLRLHEISNAHMVGRIVPYAGLGHVELFGEPAFEADRFRPLSNRRLNVFRADLAPRELEAAR